MRRLNNYMKQKIIDQIVESMKRSMIGYEVLGTPEKREWNLREIANSLYLRLKKTHNKS